MLLLLGFAFISGLTTILAPCIWPLLPIVLSSTATGATSRHRPLGIALGVMASFAFFTLTISSLVHWLHLDPNIFRWVAVAVLVFFGICLLEPTLNQKVEGWMSRVSSLWGTRGQRQGGDFVSGLITGLSLGIVWSPCAGPILATIAALAATGKVSLDVVFVTAAYVVGIGIPLFGFAYGGQKLLARSRKFNNYTQRFQKVFGILMLLTALAIFTNYDKVAEAKLLSFFPQYANTLNDFESNASVTQQLDALKGKKGVTHVVVDSSVLNVQTIQYAPELTGITHWLNSDPLTLASLKGKVVLVDFWTYTCINCIRTLPYVTKWYNTYKNDGFVVIGVHTPEFAFEHDTNNVAAALKQFGITYPVAQDNDYATWNAFNNQYWPAEYLIDATGRIRREEFGEGNYDQMEKAIQVLLSEAGTTVSQKISDPDLTPHEQLSPETYVGSARMEYEYPDGQLSDGSQNFTPNADIPVNSFSLGGNWTINDEQSVTGSTASLFYHFQASKVYLVLSPPAGQSATMTVLLDGQPISAAQSGTDVKNGTVTITSDRLYNLVNLGNTSGEHVLQLKFQTSGTEVYAFTFG